MQRDIKPWRSQLTLGESYSPVRLNTHKMALEVSIPQAALRRTARGYVDPQYWDDGIPALFSNYTFNGTDTQSDAR